MSDPVIPCFLSDTLIGAIVGGLISLSGTIAFLVFEYRKWKKGLRIDHLRQQRERLEEIFARIYKSIGTSFENAASRDSLKFSIESQSDIAFLCPAKLREKIKEAIKLDPNVEYEEAVRHAMATIAIHMKQYLAKMDEQTMKQVGCNPLLTEGDS